MRLSGSLTFFWLFYFIVSIPAYSATVCVNVNEREEPVGSGACVPAFTDARRILTAFNADLHDLQNHSQVIDRGNETIDSSTQHVIATFPGPPAQARKIYACVPPYSVDTGALKCEFKREDHACSAGDPGQGVFASEASDTVGGASKAERFQNTVNKKLACCLNDFAMNATTPVKFDCIENSKKRYADFNELWISSDDAVDGGQLNALVLTNAMGKPLTGFYTLAGSRCNEYSEFAGEIQAGKISLPNHGDAFTPVGLPFELPASSAYAYVHQQFTAKGLKVPTTVADRRRCPLLVRAAIVVQCPNNPMLPGEQKTANIMDVGGTLLHRRCSVAASAQVHIRIEQIVELETQPKMIPSDTMIEAKNASTISVDRIIANKYGNQCSPGTHRVGEVCAY
jgi:hypothetical protein